MKIKNFMQAIGKIRITKSVNGKAVWQSAWIKNLIVSSDGYGRNIICRRLTGDATYSLHVTHGEIGTGSTTPTNADTALAAAVARVQTTFTQINNNQVVLQFFFSDAILPNGTYAEFGTFIDGSPTLGSGQMFEHVLFGVAYVKNAGEDTTIEVDITIT